MRMRYSGSAVPMTERVDDGTRPAGGDKEGAGVRRQETSRGMEAGRRTGPRRRVAVPADAEKQGRQPGQRWHPAPDVRRASLVARGAGRVQSEPKHLSTHECGAACRSLVPSAASACGSSATCGWSRMSVLRGGVISREFPRRPARCVDPAGAAGGGMAGAVPPSHPAAPDHRTGVDALEGRDPQPTR